MSQNRKPVSRKDNLVVQELDGEVLVYDLRTHRALCLNETSALVWNACDGTRDLRELREYASAKSNASVNDDLIWLALDQLKKENLISEAPASAEHLQGLSRREVVKRIGLGAAIALPVVAGLVAPSVASAQSVCGTCTCSGKGTTGDPCTASTNNCTGTCTCHQANNGNNNGICSH